MKSKLAIVLWAASPVEPHLCSGPFMYAAAAAAMDAEVEIHFTAKSVELLVPGVAKVLYADEARTKDIYSFMQDAAALGVRFLACSHSLAAHLPGQVEFIPELTARAGAAAFVARALEPEWRVLSF